MKKQTRTAKKAPAARMSLAQRVRALEDVEEIKQLKASYCNYCDGGWDRPTHDYDRIADLFTEDAVTQGTAGRTAGRENIRRLYRSYQVTPFAFHRVTNPIIKVAGDRATGNWHVLVALTRPDGQAVWVAGIYDEEYVRTKDGWRIQVLKFTSAFTTRYEQGWGKERAMEVQRRRDANPPAAG
jgi:ketosteroid isomerase-like protein